MQGRLICDGCGAVNTQHALRNGVRECISWKECVTCGMKANPSTYEKSKQCFSCDLWSKRAKSGACKTVIDGHVYTPGRDTTGKWRGMGGRRFDIEYFNGLRITTWDLWSAGEIPERFRSQIPDTARFLEGAGKYKDCSGITYWNSSTTKNPPYPLPPVELLK